MKTCAVVGCHPKRFKFKYKETHTGCKRLKDQFIKLYAQGVRIFVIGSFLGVDIWSGEILLTLRKEPGYSDIHLVIVVPFNGHDKGWDEHNRTRLSFFERTCGGCVCRSRVRSGKLLQAESVFAEACG